LKRLPFQDRAHLQIVDPDFSFSGAAVDVENYGVDVGVREVEVTLLLEAHQLLLFLGNF
jgi:hypothetical protein